MIASFSNLQQTLQTQDINTKYIRRPEDFLDPLLNVLCTFNLRPGSTGKLELAFCLYIRKRFFLRVFVLKPTERAQVFLKTVLGIFKTALRLRDRHFLMWQLMKVSNVFNTLALKQIFWKTKTFFKKLEYSFLVETTKIENASFPFKTALSEANVKANRMATAKWTYHKESSFASNYFIFFRKFVPVLEPRKKS